MDFVNNQVRGCSFMFGYRAIAKFLRDNRLIYMLRAHEVQEEGFRLHFSESVDDAAPSEQASDSDFCDDSEAEDRYTETLDNPMLVSAASGNW
jgi:diadenosine tetraphosphatase ApaH/serine/threonine PP2A family protein phosphatase